jgi:FkbM family methyltransferase
MLLAESQLMMSTNQSVIPDSRFRKLVLQHGHRIPLLLAKHLVNGAEVWEAWRDGRILPPLETHGGIKWFHAASDPVFHMFFEIFVAESYVSNGFYAPSDGDAVVDCGANVGLFALFLAIRAPGIRVHCFEPAPDTLERLRENIETNHLDAMVTTYPYALAKENARRALRQHPSTGQRSFIGTALYVRERSDAVECIDLASAIERCRLETVDLLKLDIEGAEVEVLESVDPSLWKRVRRVVLEYHDDLRPGSRERVISILNAAGFHYIRSITTFPHSESTGIIQAASDHFGRKHGEPVAGLPT